MWAGRDVVIRRGAERLRIHCIESRGPAGEPGAAPPVLLLHGLLSSSLQWRGVFDRLGGRLHLLAPDLPGFGRSSLPRRVQTLPDYGDTLEAWCDAVGLGRCAVIGHSFGGMVAVEWLSRPGARAAALGLVAPAGVPHTWTHIPTGPLRIPVLRTLLGPLWIALLTSRLVERTVFGAVVADPDAVDSRSIHDFRWGIRRSREVFRNPDFYVLPDLGERLGRLRVPVHLGWGDSDRVLPPSDATVFRQHLPQASFVAWERCGHAPMVERAPQFDAFVLAVAAAASPGGTGGGVDPPASAPPAPSDPVAIGRRWPPSTPPTPPTSR